MLAFCHGHPRSGASPQLRIKREPDDRLILEIDCRMGRRHLPIQRACHVA